MKNLEYQREKNAFMTKGLDLKCFTVSMENLCTTNRLEFILKLPIIAND